MLIRWGCTPERAGTETRPYNAAATGRGGSLWPPVLGAASRIMVAAGRVRDLASKPRHPPTAIYISLPNPPATGRQIVHALPPPRPSNHRNPGVWPAPPAGVVRPIVAS